MMSGFDLSASRTITVARLLNQKGDGRKCELELPAEVIGDARIGDEFTLHLERVKK
jgi:hypothetical protein